MSFNIAKAKTRAIICSAVLIATTALSNYLSVGLGGTLLLSTLATISSGVASGMAANDLGDWARKFGQNEKILNDQRLEQAVGLTISLVILDAVDSEELLQLVEQQDLPYSHGSLRKLADKTAECWSVIANTKSEDDDTLIQDTQLIEILAKDVQSSKAVKVLDAYTWEQILNWLARAAELVLPQPVLRYLAEKLYTDFSKRLRDVLTHDAANGGVMFAEMVLDLQSEALALLNQIVSSNQEIVSELEKVAKRQDLQFVYRQMISGFKKNAAQNQQQFDLLRQRMSKSVEFVNLWQQLLNMTTSTNRIHLGMCQQITYPSAWNNHDIPFG